MASLRLQELPIQNAFSSFPPKIMDIKPTILLIEKDHTGGGIIRRILESEPYLVKSFSSCVDASATAKQGVDLVLCELATGREAAFELVSYLGMHKPGTPIVLLVESGDVESAVKGVKLGAADCLALPVDAQRLRYVVHKWAGRRASNESVNRGDEVDKVKTRRLDIPTGTTLEELERVAVQQALAHHSGNRTHAAGELGISVRTLQRKLKTWGPPILLFQDSAMSQYGLRETC